MRQALLTATALLLGTTALAAPGALTREEARHLLARTGFAPAPAEIDAITGLSAQQAVTQIVQGVSTEPSQPYPDWVNGWLYPQEAVWSLGQTAQELFFANRFQEIEELAAWWMGEMVSSPSPLTERLTLFWHDHFPTSFEDLESSQLLARQHVLLRRHAAGNFADLAQGILRDPAMLIYLTNTENVAEHPNENLGREFLELFTLGQGRGYTEEDVKQAARALTGHSLNFASEFEIHRQEHDGGRKTILGKNGRFDGQDLADIVLSSEQFGPYIVEKLWKAFVSPTPDPVEVDRLATLWKANDLELKPLLEALFLTDAFWDPENRGTLVKSPVELLAGAIRATGRAGVPLTDAAYAAYELGQGLFFPPNVGGWPSGTAWINDSTALLRANALTSFAEDDYDTGDPSVGMMMAPSEAAESLTETPEGDLRVGQVFGIWSEKWEDDEGITAVITLFDVSFGADTWRALTVGFENERYGPVIIGINTAECGPICTEETKDFADDEDGWFHIFIEDGVIDGEAPLSEQATPILKSVLGHLPSLVSETKDSLTWQPNEEDDENPASYQEIARLAKDVAQATSAIVGPPEGGLTIAASKPGRAGLAGMSAVTDLDMLDDYLDETEASRARYSAPVHVYASAEEWMAALPSPGDAAATLVAVPFPNPEGDADDVLRALLLSPAFQVK
ncbi:MAG: DUF1800 domain-containing protein [Pseudomonadota bacterium]